MPSAGEIFFTLRSSTLFDRATDDELARVAELCRIDRVAAGAVILNAGDEPDDLFLLIEGELLAYVRDEHGNELPLKRLSGQGSFFGEIAFLATPRMPRSASVRALTDSRLLRVPGETFESWLRSDRELEQRLRSLAAQQIRNSASRQYPCCGI
jgi:CRP/FNR family cyclic AMP-dependent transcriptional regulator